MKNITKFWAALAFALMVPSAHADFTIDTSRATNAPMTGMWWNHNESGWGMSIEQQGPINFVAIYAYDDAGNSIRYFISNCPIVGNTCTGDLFAVSGGQTPTQPWVGHDPVQKLGSGTLTFSDANTGVFNFTVNGVAGTKNIEREIFATGVTPPAIDFTGLFWNPNESGWGVYFQQEFGMGFAVFYTYDAIGNGVRYVASNCPINGSVASGFYCTSSLYRTHNGTALTRVWAGPISVESIGTLTFNFQDQNHATMSFTIDGQSGTKQIEREVFWTGIPASTYAAGSGRGSMFNTVNAARIAYGVLPLAQNAMIDTAATNHAQSAVLLSNPPVVSHTEVPTQPGFTGVYWSDRTAAAGYIASLGNETVDIVYVETAGEAVAGSVAANDWLSAPYHRLGLMGPLNDIGIGQVPFQYLGDTYYYSVIDMGVPQNGVERDPAIGWIGLWPVDHATEVMYGFAGENPNPIPVNNGACAGYPVSLQIGTYYTAALTVTSFTLAETATGLPLSVQLSTPTIDANPSMKTPNSAYIIPFKPLKLGTQYTAHFVGSSAPGLQKIPNFVGGPIDVTWHFTTTAQNNSAFYECDPS